MERENEKAKAQVQFNLARPVKGNRICFYEYISNKRRAVENLHPLLDAKGNRETAVLRVLTL